MRYHFLTPGHPEANGRRPQTGEESFVLVFPTDDGGVVEIFLGRKDWVNSAATICAMLDESIGLSREVANAIDSIKKMEIDE